MNKFAILILSSVFATGAFAASHTGGAPMPAKSASMPEAQTAGSAKPKAAAEDKHNAKAHGSDKSAKQPEAQAAGSDKAKASAEAKHKAKAHTGKKNSTDEQMAKDAKKL